jgi:hypothetical protein
MRKWGNISPYIRRPLVILYMTLQLLHSEFPYIWGNFDFLFYQCELPEDLPQELWAVGCIWAAAATCRPSHPVDKKGEKDDYKSRVTRFVIEGEVEISLNFSSISHSLSSLCLIVGWKRTCRMPSPINRCSSSPLPPSSFPGEGVVQVAPLFFLWIDSLLYQLFSQTRHQCEYWVVRTRADAKKYSVS